jgi:hypothetical protein
MDVVDDRESRLTETARAVAETVTFGAVDVSWTPPVRNVFVCDNESWC